MTDDFTRQRFRSKVPAKLKKPRKDFPLNIHKGSKYRCKKFRGRGYCDTCATVVKAFGKNRAVTDLTPDDFHKLRSKDAIAQEFNKVLTSAASTLK